MRNFKETNRKGVSKLSQWIIIEIEFQMFAVGAIKEVKSNS